MKIYRDPQLSADFFASISPVALSHTRVPVLWPVRVPSPTPLSGCSLYCPLQYYSQLDIGSRIGRVIEHRYSHGLACVPAAVSSQPLHPPFDVSSSNRYLFSSSSHIRFSSAAFCRSRSRSLSFLLSTARLSSSAICALSSSAAISSRFLHSSSSASTRNLSPSASCSLHFFSFSARFGTCGPALVICPLPPNDTPRFPWLAPPI